MNMADDDSMALLKTLCEEGHQDSELVDRTHADKLITRGLASFVDSGVAVAATSLGRDHYREYLDSR